jgi:hypothetical protein
MPADESRLFAQLGDRTWFEMKRWVLRFEAGRDIAERLASDQAVKIPFNMTTPNIKLGYGEEIVQTFGTLRRKGIFGNRYGELHVTNQRVAFVKAVMQGIAASAISQFGVKPAIVFERGKIQSVDKVPVRKQVALVISDGNRTERFVVDESEADTALALLA